MNTNKQWMIRILAGGACGVAVSLLIAFLTASISLFGGAPNYSHIQLAGDAAFLFYGSRELAAFMQLLSMFGVGAAAGVATLPFAETWTKMLPLSVLHFVITGALVLLAGWPYFEIPVLLLLYALVYLLIWLARWLAWWTELEQIREKLGLKPSRSVFHWRETLPWVPFAGMLCMVLPVLLHLLDPADVPVWTSIVLPFLLLPVGGFFSGLSLGKQKGICPLYPVFCALFYCVPTLAVLGREGFFHIPVIFGSALAGVLIGAAARKRKER